MVVSIHLALQNNTFADSEFNPSHISGNTGFIATGPTLTYFLIGVVPAREAHYDWLHAINDCGLRLIKIVISFKIAELFNIIIVIIIAGFR